MSGFVISFLGTTLAGGAMSPQVVSNANPLPVTFGGGGSQNVQGVAVNGAVANPNPVIIGARDFATGIVQSLQMDPGTGALLVSLGGGGGITANQGTANAGAAQSWFVQNPTAGLFLDTSTQGPGNTANPWTVQGPVANNIAATGNPVSVGGIYSTAGALGSLTVGARGEAQLDNFGNLRSMMTAPTTNGADAASNTLTRVGSSASAAAGGLLWVANSVYNGLTWDRSAKPRTAFKIPSSALSNNAANIKATPGTVYSISANVTLAGSTCYLKFFDTTGVPNPAALAQLYIFALNILDGAVSINMPAGGLYFPTGIGVAIVANPADLDNTAIALGQVTALNVSFL